MLGGHSHKWNLKLAIFPFLYLNSLRKYFSPWSVGGEAGTAENGSFLVNVNKFAVFCRLVHIY